MKPLIVGDYRFSRRDCLRTLTHANEFLDAFPAAAQHLLSARRERIATALAEVDIDAADTDELHPVLAAVWEELLDARIDVAAAGLHAPPQEGVVKYLHLGQGGVPKLPVEAFDVDYSGVIGDRQGNRKHHGSPFQALCIWNSETLHELSAAGHPIGPGNAGENVTVSGVAWASVAPGTRLQLGTVICDVSSYAVPCAKNARWFSDRDFGRIHHDRGPWSRVYATVRVPGRVNVGDRVIVEPDLGAALR